MTDQIVTTGTAMTITDLAANNIALVHENHELQRQVAILQAEVNLLQAGLAFAHDELERIASNLEETLKENGR